MFSATHTCLVKIRMPYGKIDDLFFLLYGPNSIETLEIFLEENPSININEVEPQLKKTPLMYAANLGKLQFVEVLLDRGAIKDIRNSENETAALFAARSGHKEVLKKLELPKVGSVH